MFKWLTGDLRDPARRTALADQLRGAAVTACLVVVALGADLHELCAAILVSKP